MTDGIYRASTHENCPVCSVELKSLPEEDVPSEVSEDSNDDFVYCPQCAPQTILDKASRNIIDVWDDL